MSRKGPLNRTPAARLWTILSGLLLAIVAWPAFALGLGQIEVKSQAGQPLLAEIPVISADPSELEGLQARLASPDTFRRIGLDPPTGLVSGLQFVVALDARGRPVIRITSDAPVQQPLLTFLVEVEWGQGRLVREYSALVDTPQTVAAPAQPPIQAPVVAPSNTIVRAPETAPAPEATTPAPAAETPDTPAPPPEAVAAAPTPPAPVPTPAPAPVAAPAATPGEYGPVQAGQTLGTIAAELAAGSGQSRNQTMLALLRANPEAFIGGNLNLIRQGAVLRVPTGEEWSAASIAEANAVVREHVARWREMRRPVPQPAAVADAPAATAAQAAPAAGAPRVAEARLEIVPPSNGGDANAANRTGIAAGGEGDMLQQQELVQTRESLAARDAEVQELKTRVAELEQLQQQQQQLIQMKDSELASAQQRLAQSNAQPAPTLAQADAATPPPAAADTGTPVWLWLGLALLVAALVAWWLVARRKASATRKLVFPPAAVAAVPPEARRETTREVIVEAPPPAAEAVAGDDAGRVRSNHDSATRWTAPTAAASGKAPTWHAGGGAAQAETRADTRAEAVAPLNPAPAGQERIELARAYIDLGDVDTARTLLQEVADAGDAASRGEAARLLRELV